MFRWQSSGTRFQLPHPQRPGRGVVGTLEPSGALQMTTLGQTGYACRSRVEGVSTDVEVGRARSALVWKLIRDLDGSRYFLGFFRNGSCWALGFQRFAQLWYLYKERLWLVCVPNSLLRRKSRIQGHSDLGLRLSPRDVAASIGKLVLRAKVGFTLLEFEQRLQSETERELLNNLGEADVKSIPQNFCQPRTLSEACGRS